MVEAKVGVFLSLAGGFTCFFSLYCHLGRFLHALYLFMYFSCILASPGFENLADGTWEQVRRTLGRAACDGIDSVGKGAAYIEHTPQQCILFNSTGLYGPAMMICVPLDRS